MEYWYESLRIIDDMLCRESKYHSHFYAELLILLIDTTKTKEHVTFGQPYSLYFSCVLIEMSSTRTELEANAVPYPDFPIIRMMKNNAIDLSRVISRHLFEKPNNIDSNRIFNCVKQCCDETLWYDDGDHGKRVAVVTLLFTCYNSNWFTPNQLKLDRRTVQRTVVKM